MNKTVINREKKSKVHKKVYVPLDIIRDDRLNCASESVLIYLLTLPKNFTIKKDNVISHFMKRGEGKQTIEKAWKILLNLGYLEYKNLGKDKGILWTINEIPKVIGHHLNGGL